MSSAFARHGLSPAKTPAGDACVHRCQRVAPDVFEGDPRVVLERSADFPINHIAALWPWASLNTLRQSSELLLAA